MPTYDEYVRFKSYLRKIMSPFIIYAVLNPNWSFINKYQKHFVCSYAFKLVFVDDRFSKSFKSYIGKDAA